MLGHTIVTLAMLMSANTLEWQDDKTVKIDVTFQAKDPMNPFPQGEKLLKKHAKEACADKGKPKQVGETVVTGISMAGGKPSVAMSGTYVCK